MALPDAPPLEHLLGDERLTAVGLLLETTGGLTDRLDGVNARAGLTSSDLDTLLRLARSPERRLRMSDLAAQTAMSTSGTTRVVDRLEKAGLVCRAACPTDRRSAWATLTDAGADRLAAHLPDLVAAIDTWFASRLTPAQLTSLLEVMTVLRDAVRPCATAGTGQRPAHD